MPDGGVLLDLFVEGALFARATANQTVLSDLDATLGLDRSAVLADLQRALLDAFKTQRQFVEVKDIREDPDHPLRFTGRYINAFEGEISTGVVWYDVESSTIGPEDIPAVARNRMRYEVHRKLTRPGSIARALVDLHD